MAFALGTAVVTAMLGSGLLLGGCLLQWGGRVNEDLDGGHLWGRTSAMGRRARQVGTALVVAGSLGLGPALWVVAALG